MSAYPVECSRCHIMAMPDHFDEGMCYADWAPNDSLLGDALRFLSAVAESDHPLAASAKKLRDYHRTTLVARETMGVPGNLADAEGR